MRDSKFQHLRVRIQLEVGSRGRPGVRRGPNQAALGSTNDATGKLCRAYLSSSERIGCRKASI